MPAGSRPLAGKVAVVTGGGRGVGRAIGLALARAGAHVHVVARTQAQLDEAVTLIERDGGTATAIAMDVGSPREVLDVLKPQVEHLAGPPHILINAAGIFGPVSLLPDGDPDAWIATLRVNAIAPYLTCRAFVGGMLAEGWGRIVNVSSAASLHAPGPLNSAYATSKAALNQMTRCLAAELAGTGVTANVLHPGEVKTAMWREIRDRAQALGDVGAPLGEWARSVEESGGDPPEKAAELALWLASDAASGINGRFLWIEGGAQAPIPIDWGMAFAAARDDHRADHR